MPLFQNAEVLVTIICVLGLPFILVGAILTIWYEEKQKVKQEVHHEIRKMLKEKNLS